MLFIWVSYKYHTLFGTVGVRCEFGSIRAKIEFIPASWVVRERILREQKFEKYVSL